MASSARDKTYFEQQREILLGDIALSFEQVLSNINKLNRSLEAVITVGNEFSSVETLWSQFENVMATDEEDGAKHTKQPQEQDNGEEGRISREENDHERAKK